MVSATNVVGLDKRSVAPNESSRVVVIGKGIAGFCSCRPIALATYRLRGYQPSPVRPNVFRCTSIVSRYASRSFRAPPNGASSGSLSRRQTAITCGSGKTPPAAKATVPSSNATSTAGWQSRLSMQSSAARSARPSHGDRPSRSQYCSAQLITGSYVVHPSGARPYSSEPVVMNSNQSVGDGNGVTSARAVADAEGVAPVVVVGDSVPTAAGGGTAHPPRSRTPSTNTAAAPLALTTGIVRPLHILTPRSVPIRARSPGPCMMTHGPPLRDLAPGTWLL